MNVFAEHAHWADLGQECPHSQFDTVQYLQNLVRTARLTVYYLVGDVMRYEIARRQLEGQFSPESMEAVLGANEFTEADAWVLLPHVVLLLVGEKHVRRQAPLTSIGSNLNFISALVSTVSFWHVS